MGFFDKKLWTEKHYIIYAEKYKNFFEYIKTEHDDISSTELSLMTLKECDMDLYRESCKFKLAEEFFEEKLKTIGDGELPSKKGEEVDKKWIGLAILIITLTTATGVITLCKINEEKNKIKNKNLMHNTTINSIKSQILALAMFQESLEENDIRKNFDNCRYWWSGNKDKWKELKEILKEDYNVKNHKTEMIILVYEWNDVQPIPDRISGQATLIRMIKENKIKKIDSLKGDAVKITNNGFKRQ
jgi:hypothetical protein